MSTANPPPEPGANRPEQEITITLKPEELEHPTAHIRAAARQLRIPRSQVKEVRVLKISLDARRAPVRYHVQALVGIGQPLPPVQLATFSPQPLTNSAQSVIVVGMGPAGIFAALRLLELGLKPILLERGKNASARRFDLAPILRQGTVIEDSNYCFGEGGAGTFSDGKLYTRATKRGSVRAIYELLVEHGAPKQILTEAHPHIGSNLLPKVVMNLRQSILAHGGEVHFGAKVTQLIRSPHNKKQLTGVQTQNGQRHHASAVLLATGHSARDIYELLHREGLRLEAKPFAIGVRIEHPQPLIDAHQYHYPIGSPRPRSLPAARYRLATKIRDRGVHSFCMCPGGFIVPAATENDQIVVNGMSLSRRDSPYANSGMVVTVQPQDIPGNNPLRGIHYQKALEQRAKQAGGGGQIAPAQMALDFISRQPSTSLTTTSYFPGVQPARLDQLLPKGINDRLREGLQLFGRQFPGYLGPEALMLGFETRTSSPVRIPRQPETLAHPELDRLFPCGEGAGYAGGIVSAALDGRRVAEAIATALTPMSK